MVYATVLSKKMEADVSCIMPRFWCQSADFGQEDDCVSTAELWYHLRQSVRQAVIRPQIQSGDELTRAFGIISLAATA